MQYNCTTLRLQNAPNRYYLQTVGTKVSRLRAQRWGSLTLKKLNWSGKVNLKVIGPGCCVGLLWGLSLALGRYFWENDQTAISSNKPWKSHSASPGVEVERSHLS